VIEVGTVVQVVEVGIGTVGWVVEIGTVVHWGVARSFD